MKRVWWLVVTAILMAAGVAAVRTAALRSRQVAPGTVADITIDAHAAATRLAAALTFQTISWGDPARRDGAAFLALHAYLASTFPRVAQTLTRETIADYSLLYTWTGARTDLPPLILCAHFDVVPAENTADASWTHPPFSGVVDSERVWGRGAVDDKSSAVGILEAAEALIASGARPQRTIYFAFSHTEEDDTSGATAIARTLAGRGVRGAWLLDEGGLIVSTVPGVSSPVAFVGLTEKAAVTLELVAEAAGGHAAMPPRETAVGILARALDRLERHPMPERLDGVTREMFETLAPEMRWPMRAAFANLWATRPLITRMLARRPDTDALIRTTTAPTMLSASPKINVLATSARAAVNFRLLPGDTTDTLVAHVTSVVDDPRVKIRVAGDSGTPPPVSRTDVPEYAALARAVRAAHPDVLVAPFLTTAATDARVYASIAPHTYRLLPVYQEGTVQMIHGVNESIRIDAYERAVRTYATLMLSADR